VHALVADDSLDGHLELLPRHDVSELARHGTPGCDSLAAVQHDRESVNRCARDEK
jgi:hypothetical protein